MAKNKKKKKINEQYGNGIAPISLQNDKFTIKTPEPKKKTKKEQEEYDKKQKEAAKSLGNAVEYTAKKTGLGAIQGITGFVDAPMQNVQEGVRRTQNKSVIDNAKNLIVKNALPGNLGRIPDTMNDISQILADPNKKGWQKAVNAGMELVNSFSLAGKLEDAGQLYGVAQQILGRNAEKDIQKTREVVNKPSEELTKVVEKDREKLGRAGQIAGDTGQVVGNMIPSIAASIITGGAGGGAAAQQAASLFTMGVSAKGQATREAEQRGADLSTANNIGMIKGLTEVLTEKISGGVKLFGKGSIDDIVEKGLNKYIKNKGLNYLAKQGVGVLGENIEEWISDVVDTAIDKATVDPDAKYTFKDWANTGMMTVLSTLALNGLTGGYSPSSYINNATELERANQTENAQKVIESELQSRLATEFKGKATAKEIAKLQAEIIEDMKNGYISTDTIEKTLGGETYNQLNKINEERQNIQTQIDELQQKADNNELSSLEEKQKLNDLKEQISKIDDTEIRNQLNQEIQETIKNDIGLQESYKEVGRRTENYSVDLSKVENEKQRAVYQKAMDSGVLNNSNKTHALVDMIAKISADKNINFDFTNNEQLEKSGFGVNGRNINGYVTDSGITINLNSQKAINRIVGHELTHTFEGTTLYTELQDSLKDFLGSEWDNQVERYKELYKGVKNANIENELTSDLIGDYLFTDENYVRNLSTGHRNLFQKIHDEIKYLYNVATAGSKEKRQLEKVKRTFDRIYNETESKVTTEDAKLSLSKSQQKYLEKTNNNEKLKEKEFYSLYSAHKVYNEKGNALEKIKSIQENGFRGDGGFGVNLTPAHKIYKADGTPMFADDYQYAPKKGDYVIFVPESEVDTKGGAYRVKQGFKPRDFEVVQVERDYQPYYELYEKAYDKYMNNKTKYSLSEDSQGRKLSENQKEYFKNSKVVDDNGNLKVMYNGSGNHTEYLPGFMSDESIWGKGIYLTPYKDVAENYGSDVKETYVNIEKPIGSGKNLTFEQYNEFYKAINDGEEAYREEYDMYDNDFDLLWDATNKGSWADYADELKEYTGYDGIIVDNPDAEESDQMVIAFKSNQVKNVSNENPTSNADIRYSISEETGKLQENGNDVTLETTPVGNTGTLMAIHNLNENKANGVLDLGGFPYPSIAITNPSKLSHEGYGDISVLFNKDTINPESNPKNKVYSRDAYTPRFPKVEYKLNNNEISKLRKTIGDYDYRNAQPGDNYISDARSIIDNLEDNINRSGIDKTLDDIKNSDAMKYVYIKNTNPNFKVETKNEQFSNIYSNETLQRFLDNYDGKYELNDIPSNEVDNYTKTMVDAYKQQLQEEYDNPEIIQIQIKNLEDRFASKDNFLRAAYKLQKYGIEHQVLDTVATKEKINNSINQEDYNKWVDNQFKDIIEKKGLRNNKDYYTSSGTPRSFEQLHDDYTLDNVVKILDALDSTGAEGGMFTGVGEIAGNASVRFNNIEDIKANENLLTEIGNEEYGKMIEDIQNRLSNIEESIMDRGHNNSDNYFIARDNLSSAIADAARLYGENKKVDANRVSKILNEYGFSPNNTESQQIVDMFSELRQLPTQYFEAKPKRAVGLDEVEQWVIPNTSSNEFKQRLQNLGLQYTEYDPSIEGDRQRVINQFDNLKFSLNNNQRTNQNNDIVLSQDSQGRELSEGQQEYFKDSKVRDDEGRLLEVYHGTPTPGFTIFDTTKSGKNTSSGEYGLYFTDSKEFADDFSYERLETDSMFFDRKGEKGDVYPVYLNSKNMLDFANLTKEEIENLYNYASNLGKIDGKEKFVENMLKWQQIGNHQLMKGNLDLKAIADSSNYDGIKAKLNVQGNENEYIVFESNQIKNIDNLTPTKSDDIRYSISMDSKNTKLNENQQEYFIDSKVRDKKGRLLRVYHGTPYMQWDSEQGKFEPFYKFDKEKIGSGAGNIYGKGFYFTNKQKDAIGYSDVVGDGSEGHTYEVYLNITNPYYANTSEAGYINTQKLQEQGYDGVIVESGNGTTYVAFEPNQIKNIDNLNPTENDDIRYSLDRMPISKNFLTEAEQDELDGLRAVENSGFAELTSEEQSRMMELENRANKVLDKKAEKMLRSASYKAINTSTKIAENYLDFDARQKKEFRNQMREFSNMTRDELVNAETYNKVKDIVNQYANKEYTYFDDSIENVKKELKHTKIQISDELKNQITDYGDFVRDSRLLLRRNSGESVDKVYKEYSEMYPGFFDENVWNEADQLEALNDFANHDFSVTEKYRLSDNDLKAATDLIYNKLLDNSLTQQDLIETEEILDKKVQKRTRSVVREELLNKMGITPELIEEGNDISAISFARTDPIRVNEKVFGWKTGQIINDATVNFTKHQEAERIRFLNKERQEIKDLGIKARSKESELVQKYGEKQYVDKNNEVHKYGDAELARDVQDAATREKIKNAARVLRQKYDTYIDRLNSVMTEMGYDEIPKRKDYMMHFVELEDKFSRWGLPFNKESMSAEDLPTDINGLTEFNRPGRSYFASAKARTGLQTTYDAITGIDKYLEGMSNWIYHTESIQRYRALSRFIRENYGREHGLDNIDLMTDEELADRIKDIQDNKLSKYVAWLDEQANSIAGKKATIDRSLEKTFGRKVYTALNTLKSQIGSNMTGFNVRSAMTNFASLIQGMSKTQKMGSAEGLVSTVRNIVHDDGLMEKSDFLTSRLLQSESLAVKPWQKLSKAGQVFMEGTDWFTANAIWRGKYYENLHKGMSEQQAIKNADDFAARIMGDRSKGATAELFNSKTWGFLTQFQLEVNNQWSSLIHDNKIDIQKGNKTPLGVTFELGQLFAASYMFNTMMKSLTGSDVMIDPIDMMKKIFFPDDDEDKTLVERAEEVLGDFINQLPFASMFTGGRIPIGEAFKGGTTLFNKVTGKTDKYGNEIEWEDVGEEFKDSLAYWILPTGWGQIKKTTKGLSMYDDKLPIAGSYTKSGNLRFSAEDTPFGRVKAGLFGQYSSKYAQDYIDSGYKSINASKLDEMKDLDMNSTEYRNYREGLSAAGTSVEDKLDYINSLDVPYADKDIMASNVAKKDIDMKEYNKYGSYEEFNYAQKNPAKYQVMKYIGGYDTYKNYEKEINDIKADYDRNGKAITNSRKNKVIKYVNSLNLTKAQKAMLIKEQYPSFTKYDKEIASYINSQNIRYIEKASILKQLGFTAYDRQIINYIKQNYRTVEEQQEELEKLGFKVYNYNGKTYVR